MAFEIKVINTQESLESTRALCQELRQKLTACKASLDHYKRKDQPAFSQWYTTNLPEERERAARTQYANELLSLVHEVEETAFLEMISDKKAYKLVLQRKDPAYIAKGKQAEEEFIKILTSAFGMNPEDFQEGIPPFDYQEPQDIFTPLDKAQDLSESDSAHLKKTYRDLARKLHPDSNQNLSAEEKELWTEVQDAYKNKDSDLLEHLAAQLEGHITGFTGVTSEKMLQQIAQGLKSQLRSTEKLIRKYKNIHDWDFAAILIDPKRLKRRRLAVERRCDRFAAEVEEGIAALEAQIEQWKKPADKKKPTRNRSHYKSGNPHSSGPST